LVACSIDCLSALFWQGVGTEADISDMPNTNVMKLTEVLKNAGGNLQPAWTVREAAPLCVASLAMKCHQDILREHHSLISTMVMCAAQALRDRKFWRVRLSGVKILYTLVSRVGSDTSVRSNSVSLLGQETQDDAFQERQLLLEAMLPHKEDILKLVRSNLSDSEAKITALSSEVISTMSWWP